MNFLERIFALSPDGGSGATEVLLLSVLACGCGCSICANVACTVDAKRLQTRNPTQSKDCCVGFDYALKDSAA